jgi:hypothetical protein
VTAGPVPGRWQRFLRFSVRGLIVLVLVIGAGLGWLARSARVQREAVAAIKSARGSVAYDWAFYNGRIIRNAKPWGPRWLVNFIGVDYFGHVTAVRLVTSSTKINEPIVHVGRLTELQRLDLVSRSIRDADLSHLKGLTMLSRLNLHMTRITDAGLVNLKALNNLSELWLDGTQLTDAGLVHLKGLTKLTKLDLSYTRVSDGGMTHLIGLANLSELGLAATEVTDAGLARLKGLTKLSKLDLSNTRVSEVGVNELQQTLPSLTIIRCFDVRPIGPE